jgi:hypothetical protein
MQEGADKSDHTGSNFCHFIDGECTSCRSDLDDQPNEVHQFRRCHRMDKGEIQYDWLFTLASMWDDPQKDFDINLEH